MTDLDQVLARFPERATEIRRMCLRDSIFRSICDDLGLAYRSLGASWLGGDTGATPEMQELGILRAELEAELIRYLDRSPHTGRPRF